MRTCFAQVDKTVEVTRKGLADGMSVVIGLQSTGPPALEEKEGVGDKRSCREIN